ncbi:MAG TPA: aldo/keto reductase [Burkholderiales bacterium]
MEYRKLGHSGIAVSALSLGSWLTFEYIGEQDGLAVIARAIDGGINFLDDARYDDRTGKAPIPSGYSEVVFGRLLRKGGWKRESLVIANKLWFEFYPKEDLTAELNGSLSRLQMDYLDIVYCAEPPASLPLLDMLRQIERLIASGKLRTWGVLNWPAEQIEDTCKLAIAERLPPPCAAQLPYSIVQRLPVEMPQTQRVCDAHGIGVVASYTLHGGLLSGKYSGAPASTDHRMDGKQLEELRRKGMLEKAAQVADFAQELGCTSAQLAIAYCLKNPSVASVLFGAKTPKQVEENLGALNILGAVDDGILNQLRAITP